MNENYIPQRGVDFDDFIGSEYFDAQKGLANVKFTPVFCPANENHSDDFIGIRYTGYATNAIRREDRGKLMDGIMYPAKNFTKEDMERLFDDVKQADGTVKKVCKRDISLDEVYIRVCYSKKEGKADNIKWVAAVEGGEVLALHGERRVYQPTDAEA